MAAMRPLPSSLRTRRCEMMLFRLLERSISSCLRRSSGKKLMMRSSVWLALLECSVLMHRWPGFREYDGMLHGFRIADFADQNHVGGLPQGVFQCVMPGSACRCRRRDA